MAEDRQHGRENPEFLRSLIIYYLSFNSYIYSIKGFLMINFGFTNINKFIMLIIKKLIRV